MSLYITSRPGKHHDILALGGYTFIVIWSQKKIRTSYSVVNTPLTLR